MALKSDPNTIIFENTLIQVPGKYVADAGTNDLIIKSHFNLPGC